MKNINKILVVFALFISSSIFAQGGSVGILGPVSAGMGNTYTAHSRGIYAVGKNPANLVFSPENKVEFATVLPIPNVTFLGGTDFISISDYNYFFGGVEENGETVGRYLTQADKDRLKKLFADGGTIQSDFSIDYLNIVVNLNPKIGTIGFKMSDNFGLYADLPAQISDIALEGNPEGSVYNFGDMKLNMQYLRTYSLSYAREITELKQNIFKKISAGITFNFITGYAMAHTERTDSYISTGTDGVLTASGNVLAYTAFSEDFGVDYDFDSTDVEDNMGFFPKPAGSGFGIDLGFAAQLDDVWSFGLSITGIGSVTWDKKVAEFTSNNALVIDDITDQDTRDSLAEVFTGEGKYVSEYSTSLPTALHIGATYQLDKAPYMKNFPGTLLIAFDYHQGFNDVARNSTKPRFALGFEWRPWKIFPIRTGFSAGGVDKSVSWSFGTGLDWNTFEFSFAAYNFSSLMQANDATKISMAFGTRWRI